MMLQTAKDALARRDVAAALAASRAVLETEPQLAEGHHLLGLALQLDGKPADAMAAFDRAAELDPDDVDVRLSQARLALSLREFERAEQALGHALRLDPNSLTAYAISAHLALGRGRIDDAGDAVKRAERLSPHHPLTLCMAGNLALARGDHEAAQKALHEAAERAPDEPLVLSSLALAYVAADKHAFAEQALRRVLERDPSQPQLRRLLVDALRKQQRIEELPAELEQLIAQQPNDWQSLALLGDSRMRLGQRDAALDAYRRLLAVPGMPLATLDAVLQVLGRHGDFDGACALLDELLEAHPEQDVLWQRRQACAVADTDWHEAFIARWLQRHPDSTSALLARAGLREQLGRLDEAAADASAVLEREPGMLQALLIRLRKDVRDAPDQAIERIDATLPKVEQAAVQSLLHRMRAFALDRLQRPDQAVRDMQAAAEKDDQRGPLPTPRPAEAAAPAGDSQLRPRLLWGAPGARIGQWVDLLRGARDVHVLDDRFGTGARPDGLGPARPDGAMATKEGWAHLLAKAGLSPDQVVDWLPFWDERIASALPGSRLLAIVEDPRDLLLNWLVFGARQGPAPVPSAAAGWLLASLEPLAARIDAADPDLLVFDGSRTDADPDAALARAREFFALPAQKEPARAALTEDPRGLPGRFEPGHWRGYREALAAEFDRLRPLAVRLGYPAD